MGIPGTPDLLIFDFINRQHYLNNIMEKNYFTLIFNDHNETIVRLSREANQTPRPDTSHSGLGALCLTPCVDPAQ